MDAEAETAITSVTLPEPFAGWFAGRGWRPHEHQFEMLEAAREGQSAAKRLRGSRRAF